MKTLKWKAYAVLMLVKKMEMQLIYTYGQPSYVNIQVSGSKS